MTTKGFHVCKAGNAPTAGQIKTFVVTGDRIKSKPIDQGGASYTIVSAVQRESYKDSYGNLGYDIVIEPQNGAQSPQNGVQRVVSQDERSNRIERQHSQEMAIRYAALKGLALDTTELRKLIDWFQRDVGRMPQDPQPEPEVKRFPADPAIQSEPESAEIELGEEEF